MPATTRYLLKVFSLIKNSHREASGASVRVVNAPKELLCSVIKNLLATHGMKMHTYSEAERQYIHGIAEIDSYVKFFWKGKPQIAEWIITSSGDDRVKVELRLRLIQRYRILFWGLIIVLLAISLGLFHIPFYLFDKTNYGYLLLAMLFCAACIVFCFLIALRAVSAKGGENFIDSFWQLAKKECEETRGISYEETILEDRTSFPDIFIIPFVYVCYLALFFFLYHNFSFIELIIVCFVGSLLFVFLSILKSMLKYPGFSERILFALLGMAISLSLTLIYSPPYLSQAFGDIPTMYQRYWTLVHHLDAKEPANAVDLSNLYRLKRVLMVRAVLVLSCYAVVLTLGLGILALTPKLASGIVRRKTRLYQRMCADSHFHLALEFGSFSKVFSFGIFSFWLLATATILFCAYSSLSFFEIAFFGKNSLLFSKAGMEFFDDLKTILSFLFYPHFSVQMSAVVLRLVSLSYVAPLFLIGSVLLAKRLRDHLSRIREFAISNTSEDCDNKIKDFLSEISQDVNIRIPKVVFRKALYPHAEAQFVGFPFFRGYLTLTQGCLKLSDDEIKGLIAHELFHLKKHTQRWYILDLLSKFSFFGTGFLACAVGSYQIEFEADEFAWKYLKGHGVHPQEYINALKMIEISSTFTNKLRMREGSLSFVQREDVATNAIDKKKASFLQKIKTSIKILLEIYFGNSILSYIHPSIAERIENLMRLEARTHSTDLY